MKNDGDPFRPKPPFRVAQGGVRLWSLVVISVGLGALFAALGIAFVGTDEFPTVAAALIILMGLFCVHGGISLLRSGYEIRAGEIRHINALLRRTSKLSDLADLIVVEYRIDRRQGGGPGLGTKFAILDLWSLTPSDRLTKTGDRKKTPFVEQMEQRAGVVLHGSSIQLSMVPTRARTELYEALCAASMAPLSWFQENTEAAYPLVRVEQNHEVVR